MTTDQLRDRFTHHAVTSEQFEVMEVIREHAFEMAKYLEKYLGPSRELSTALRKLEEATFWGCAGVSRNGLAEPPQS